MEIELAVGLAPTKGGVKKASTDKKAIYEEETIKIKIVVVIEEIVILEAETQKLYSVETSSSKHHLIEELIDVPYQKKLNF